MAAAAAALSLLLLANPSGAKVFHAKDEALKLAFPTADHVEMKTIFLDDAQTAEVEERARAQMPSQLVSYYIGRREQEVLGYAFLDTHIVRTLPETFMVVLSPAGEVEAVHVLAFYEPLEYLPAERWLGQFRGRSRDAPLRVGRDLHAVTGATLTTRALAAGVRRILALFEVAVARGER